MEAFEILGIAAEIALLAAIAGNVVLALRLFRQVRAMPTPVVTAQPISAARSRGKSRRIGIAAASVTTAYSPKEPTPRNPGMRWSPFRTRDAAGRR